MSPQDYLRMTKVWQRFLLRTMGIHSHVFLLKFLIGEYAVSYIRKEVQGNHLSPQHSDGLGRPELRPH